MFAGNGCRGTEILQKHLTKAEIKEYMAGMFDFKPANYQLDFAHSCMNKKEIVAVFSRQSGKSTTTSRIAIMLARNIPDNPVLVFAPTDRQAMLISQKIQEAIKKLPFVSHFHIIRQTMREFYFSNGGSIICQTTGDTGQTILGFTAGAIILEEAGSIKDSIVHTSIMPMGATTDPVIIKIGTPKGKNHFYESSINPDAAVHQIDYKTAVAEGIVQQEYVDKMKIRLTDLEFKTEMCAEFIEDADSYFGYHLIESCISNIQTKHKPDNDKIYFMGCDIARLGQDSTVFTIVEKEADHFKVVKIVEIEKSKLDRVVDEIMRLDNIWGFQQIYIDETGLGAGVVDFVSRKYNFKRNDSINYSRAYTTRDKIVGVKFTMQSKLDIFSNLKNLMEQGLLKYPKHKKLISQLRDFRYEMTEAGNIKLHHGEYGFDDCVDSLALSVKGVLERGVVVQW